MGIFLRIALPVALVCIAAAGASASGPGTAGADATCMPRVVDGWLRPPPMPMPMMAGFARIDNPCAATAIVVGAHSDAFASVELHETRVVDGVSRMRGVAELPVVAGAEVVMRPGGLHLMLMRPVSPLAAGDVARVELILADGRRVGADFEVRAADAR